MRSFGIFAWVVVACVAMTGRAEAQQVCAYGQPCVVVVPQATGYAPGPTVYAPPTSGYSPQASPAVPTLDPELAPRAEPVVRTRPRWRLVAAGAVMLGAAWALNLAGSAIWSIMPTQHDPDYLPWALVPIVGPFAQLANLEGEDWQRPVLALIGGAQIAGLVLAIVGTATRQEVTQSEPEVFVAPYASTEGAGASVAVTF
jgi:hypothetical protein